MKKGFPKFLCLLLAVLMIGVIMPATAYAAPTDPALSNSVPGRTIDAGSVEKQIDESGVYYRLPRLTDVCKSCGNVLREFVPDDYYGCSYTLSDPSVLTDCSFEVGTWPQNDGYRGLPCLRFNYKAAKAGTTTVTLKFYYKYDVDGETGYCDNPRCGAYVVCPANYNHYYDVVTFKVTVPENEATYTVTYTDGVEGEEVFTDQVYSELAAGAATPAFNGTPSREGYRFAGWDPEVQAAVSGNVTYTAKWEQIQDPVTYTVTYTDGVEGEEVFADQIYSELAAEAATPAFVGTPSREGYRFAGWNPEVQATVSGNVTYTAKWEKEDAPNPDDQKPDDQKPDDQKPDNQKPDDNTNTSVKPVNSGTTTSSVSKTTGRTPKTGDENPMMKWSLLLLLSAAGVGGITMTVRKRRSAR